MRRRKFVKNIGLGGLVFSTPLSGLLSACGDTKIELSEFQQMVKDLLTDWCDGMIRNQIVEPANPERHGALGCPSCDHIHGRCMDAVYPFLFMADESGDKKYLDAAVLVMQWAENNVSQADGSWTVIPNPKSWKGISVFGAIALGEALHYHGHVLSEAIRNSWTERLRKVADYILKTFSIDFTNVNYGFTAVYGLHLMGKVLHEPKYTDRSKELAKEVKNFFTKPNTLLWGEAKPIDKKSAKGLPGVDLGYNVEESLNSVVLYAIEENDTELLELLEKSLASHAEFMLPDGAWDNTWGTRHNKWSYWGSRTTDGCQMGFGMMADRNPAFGRVAYQSTKLLKDCTADGLLHGGPHYISHGIKPCIHHTFAHAKPLAGILDAGKKLPKIDINSALPCEIAYGVKEFPEISTWLISNKSWRGTVTSYDALYIKDKPVQQATGGALSVLYHKKVGLLFAASMAKYIIVETNNQQHYDGEEFALTPRIEVKNETGWFTNLYDLEAEVKESTSADEICFEVATKLQNEKREKLSGVNSNFSLKYKFTDDSVEVIANALKDNNTEASLVLPVASVNSEKVIQTTANRIEIVKPEGTVVLESNVPLSIKPTERGRVFNLVPGVEAVPVLAKVSSENHVSVKISII
ncbi:hypothetical protein [Draconibacterium sediminis]|uniref:Alginate lyase domain-containing protein n=1 Tax=Draconibacterium sediminis TaxID=1544798 RepID=A0A0D8J949_9BACT|nr:hypothetical protein [Draconibacterium sediminis]KJF43525.1 hypothetical protein LH29_15060 [Draconibacterium sediminis]